jgi:hypothetical protein
LTARSRRPGRTLSALVVSAVAASALAGASSSQSAVPVAGLVGYWAFDEGSGSTAADGSGNGHTGSLNYGASWASGGNCKLGNCLSFDGNDDYVRIPDHSQLRITGDLTITAWIKPNKPGSTQSIVSKRYEYELGPISATSPYPLNWSHKNSSGTLIQGPLTSSSQTGQWQHVALVRSGNQITGYTNATPTPSSTYSSPPSSSSYPLNIGRNPGSNQRFNGHIDEVRIYNRALTPTEIQAVYGAG